MQISQTRTGPLQSLACSDDADVVPHQAANLVPVMINDDHFIYILSRSRAPFRQSKGLMIFRVFRLQKRFCAALSQHERLEQRIACESICAVQTGASHLPYRKKSAQSRCTFEIGFNSTALVMRCRNNRNRLTGDIDPKSSTGFIDVRESVFDKLRRLLSNINKDALCAGALHFRINGARDYITWS